MMASMTQISQVTFRGTQFQEEVANGELGKIHKCCVVCMQHTKA